MKFSIEMLDVIGEWSETAKVNRAWYLKNRQPDTVEKTCQLAIRDGKIKFAITIIVEYLRTGQYVRYVEKSRNLCSRFEDKVTLKYHLRDVKNSLKIRRRLLRRIQTKEIIDDVCTEQADLHLYVLDVVEKAVDLGADATEIINYGLKLLK